MSIFKAVKSLYRHQFFSLSAGVAASNLISLLVMPFLARIYGSEGFGTFAVFYAITAILGTFSTLRLDQAIPIIEESGERSALARVALTSSFLLCFLFGLILAVAPFPASVHWPHDHAFALSVALAAFLLGLLNIQTTLAIKGGHLRAISLRYFAEKITTSTVAFALSSLAGYGLILAQILGYTVSVIILTIGTRNTLFREFKVREPFLLIRKYKDFPLQNGLSTAFQILQIQLPALIFSALYPLEMVGFYNLAQRIIDAPNTIVGSSLGTVFYRRLLGARKQEMIRIYMRTMLWAGAVMLIPMTAIAVFATRLVEIAFGEPWKPAAAFFVLLLPAAFFRMLYLVGQYCLLILRRLDFGLGIAAVSLALTFIGIGVGYMKFGDMYWSVGLANIGVAGCLFSGLLLIRRELVSTNT